MGSEWMEADNHLSYVICSLTQSLCYYLERV